MDFDNKKCVVCGSEPNGRNSVYRTAIGYVCNRCQVRGELWAIKMAYAAHLHDGLCVESGTEYISADIETAIQKAESGESYEKGAQ